MFEESNLIVGERGGVEYASFMRPWHFVGPGKVVKRNVLTTFEFATVVVVGTVDVDDAVVDDIVCSCFVDLEQQAASKSTESFGLLLLIDLVRSSLCHSCVYNLNISDLISVTI